MKSESAATAEPVGLSNWDIRRFIVVSKELLPGKERGILCRNERKRYYLRI
jgi:hypothetical protein